MKEPPIIASTPKEELMFEASVRVCGGKALWLEDGVDVPAQCDDVELHEEVVFQKSNDVL